MGFKVVTKKMIDAPTEATVLVPDKPDDYFGILIKYVPAPVIAAYKLIEEMFVAAGRTGEMPLVYLLFLVITPLAVAGITKEESPLNMEHLKSIKVQIVMSTLGFVIWTLVMSRWITFDPLWGTVYLVLFTVGAPAVGKGLYEKGL
ncbi:MAG: hypothetical protein AM324_014775 [Candidatus Thorarchaeota archaeon SMTZ1-83]|nr:MAG: hypothetical protein AM324_15915 [Candidatus Thorarchaeota archaeon SMTZ1-83]